MTKICPFLSEYKTVLMSKTCLETNCAMWDEERECCSFNTKPIVINKAEGKADDQYKTQLKQNIDILLNEKTGWGRVELKERLLSLIDITGSMEVIEEMNLLDEAPF